MHGRCLVTSAKRGEFDVITVVLGADTKRIRTQDSIKLIEYAYENYEKIDISKIAKEKFEEWELAYGNETYINKGIKNTVGLRLENGKKSVYPINKKDINNVNVEISSIKYFEAPIEEGKIIR